ncbi:MAG: adenylyltransferase/cytidyltransferase family protein [bacterium]|nr:adenylyltransferase/cytidyltransferase family protein [bacterium]
MAQIEYKDLSVIREKHKNQKIVFASGGFDLMHAGHALFFEDCKKQGDVLVVAIPDDEIIKRDKGKHRPILNQYLRIKMVDSLKPVDYVFFDRSEYLKEVPKGSHPLHILGNYFAALRPDKYVINEDAFDIPYRKELVKKHGVKLIVLERWFPPEFEGISTTKIIKKLRNEEST